jgi:hypothetical protein
MIARPATATSDNPSHPFRPSRPRSLTAGASHDWSERWSRQAPRPRGGPSETFESLQRNRGASPADGRPLGRNSH